jgi:hypothetical protein
MNNQEFMNNPEFPREHIQNGQRVIDLWHRSEEHHRSGTITNVRLLHYWGGSEIAFEVEWDSGGTKLFLIHPTRTIGLHP